MTHGSMFEKMRRPAADWSDLVNNMQAPFDSCDFQVLRFDVAREEVWVHLSFVETPFPDATIRRSECLPCWRLVLCHSGSGSHLDVWGLVGSTSAASLATDSRTSLCPAYCVSRDFAVQKGVHLGRSMSGALANPLAMSRASFSSFRSSSAVGWV